MEAKKCDRCGEFYIERKKTALEEFADNFFPRTKRSELLKKLDYLADFCPLCSTALIEWILIGGETNGEQVSEQESRS